MCTSDTQETPTVLYKEAFLLSRRVEKNEKGRIETWRKEPLSGSFVTHRFPFYSTVERLSTPERHL